MTSGRLWPVSTCSSVSGNGAGASALSATCSSTAESLPPLNSSAGRSNSAMTSRMISMASASSARNVDSSPAGFVETSGGVIVSVMRVSSPRR